MSNVIPFPIARAAATPRDPNADLSDMRAATFDRMRELLKLAFPQAGSQPIVAPAIGRTDAATGARERLYPGEVESLRRMTLNTVHAFAAEHGVTPAAVVEALEGIVERRFYRKAAPPVESPR